MSKMLTNLRFLKAREAEYPYRVITGHEPRPEEIATKMAKRYFIRVPISRDHVVWGFQFENGRDWFIRNYKENVKS